MIRRQFGLLKTTALGGLLFLLPLFVVAALVGQIVPFVVSAGTAVGEWLPIRTPSAIALVAAIVLLGLLLLCFLAGMAARFSIGQRFSSWAERNLQLLFPRYAIIREQMAGNIGTGEHGPRLVPVIVVCPEGRRLAFEADRTDELVAVYLPGSPDTWSGYVVYVEPDRVQRLEMEFQTAVTLVEGLGRESIELLSSDTRRP